MDAWMAVAIATGAVRRTLGDDLRDESEFGSTAL